MRLPRKRKILSRQHNQRNEEQRNFFSFSLPLFFFFFVLSARSSSTAHVPPLLSSSLRRRRLREQRGAKAEAVLSFPSQSLLTVACGGSFGRVARRGHSSRSAAVCPSPPTARQCKPPASDSTGTCSDCALPRVPLHNGRIPSSEECSC